MDFFRKNPFSAMLAAGTAIVAIAALIFLYSGHSLFLSEADAYAANTGKLGQLQSARPGPSEENLQSTKQELDQTRSILERLAETVAAESAPFDSSLTPQQFQDALTEQLDALSAEAEKTGVVLPEDFALGFEPYRAELPSPSAAPFLGQQLRSIGNVVSLLVKARVKSILSLSRTPLSQESEAEEKDSRAPSSDDRLADVKLAPFDIAFEADQANVREVINSLVAARPMDLVRLLDIANSQPQPPAKQSAETPGVTAGETEAAKVPVIFGQESLIVNLRLAAVSSDVQSKQE